MSSTVVETLKITNVSCKTTLSCLDQICALKGISSETEPGHRSAGIEDDAVPVSRLIEIAGERGLVAKPARLDWEELRAVAATDAVLLLLNNTNGVAVIGNGFYGPDAVVASDPLNRDGALFYLLRGELEPGWDGDALIVGPLPDEPKRFYPWLIALLCVGAVLGPMALLLPRMLERPAAVPPSVAENSSEKPAISGPSQTPQPIDERRDAGNAKETIRLGAAPATVEVPPSIAAAIAAREPEALRAIAPPSNAIAATPAGAAGTRTSDERPAAGGHVLAALSPAPREAAAPPPPPAAEPKPEPAPAIGATIQDVPGLPAAAVDQFVARGDALVAAADVVSARLFYERAAEAGDGRAALRLGETYDPQFLARARLDRVRADPARAAHWYRRARDLGVSEAEILLTGVESKQR